jgi:hypothetical protein
MSAMSTQLQGTAQYQCCPYGDMATNSTNAYTDRRYYFRNGQKMSWINRLAQLFTKYDATHNPYGFNITNGLFAMVTSSGSDKYSMVECSYLGAAFAEIDYGDNNDIRNELPAIYDGDASATMYQQALTGGTSTPIAVMSTSHPLWRVSPDIVLGYNIGKTKLESLRRSFFHALMLGRVQPCSGGNGGKRTRRSSGKYTKDS